MPTAAFTLPSAGAKGFLGLHRTQPLITSGRVVAGLLLPSTGQCQFLQPLLGARTEEFGL